MRRRTVVEQEGRGGAHEGGDGEDEEKEGAGGIAKHGVGEHAVCYALRRVV